ncbi:MAG: PAS domain-containing protein [Gammaproteobacteria bacterium]
MNNKRRSTGEAAVAAERGPAPRFETRILRLVRGARERNAIAHGEVDAILDTESGRAILLPDAQAALLKLKRHYRLLVNLASDGHWEQDEHFRFIACTGVPVGAADCADMLGRAWWDLELDDVKDGDWRSLRAELVAHRAFRDFELRQCGDFGAVSHFTVSGAPNFDEFGRFRGYLGITRDVTARRATASEILESLPGLQSTLNALGSPACVLNEDGTIVACNDAWPQCPAGMGGSLSVGSHYLTACLTRESRTPLATEVIGAGIAQVGRGERMLFAFERELDTDAGRRWVLVAATALRRDDRAYVVLAHEDISARRRDAQWQALECNVAMRLAGAAEPSAALLAVLAAVCEAQRWDCGQYFAHDASSASLSRAAQWSVGDAPEVEMFLARAPQGRFPANAGLSGRVCQTMQPLWLRDARDDQRSATAWPHEIGLRGVFVLPVSAEGRMHGVLVFGSRAGLEEPDESCLRSVASIGLLLGHYLRRETERQALLVSERRLRRYAALGCDWQFETDSELRLVACTEARITEVGDILGRRLWELPHLSPADEPWVRVRAELAARWSFCDFGVSAAQPDGRATCYRLSGEPMFDESGVFRGYLGIGLEVPPP